MCVNVILTRLTPFKIIINAATAKTLAQSRMTTMIDNTGEVSNTKKIYHTENKHEHTKAAVIGGAKN